MAPTGTAPPDLATDNSPEPPAALRERRSRPRGARIGLLFALVVSVALFTQFGIGDRLSRDEAIYAYGGQRLAAGVPYYVSIFDDKTPLSPSLAGAGVGVARALGADDVKAVRIVFLAFACAAAVAVYLLALALWGSVVGAVVSVAAFVSYKGFAIDALGGPDAKTPGVTFAVLAMVLVLRGRWLWAGFAGALAFLVWQPLGVYVAVAVAAALIGTSAAQRRAAALRALAGAAIPVAATAGYYAIAGALPALLTGAVRYPLTGVRRTTETVGQRIGHIVDVVNERYGALHGALLWGGLAALAVAVAVRAWRAGGPRRAVRDPVCLVVVASLVPILAFSAYDFQGYPDVYPVLPYAALGLGGAWALVVSAARSRRAARAATVVGLAAAALLSGVTWEGYSTSQPSLISLKVQRARAAEIQQILGPRGTLYAIGDPTALVLTHRSNANRYIYLGSGVFAWMVAHTPGGFAGWKAQLLARDPGVIVVHTYRWHGPEQLAFARLLARRYDTRWLGSWEVLVKPALLARAQARGIILSRFRGP